MVRGQNVNIGETECFLHFAHARTLGMRDDTTRRSLLLLLLLHGFDATLAKFRRSVDAHDRITNCRDFVVRGGQTSFHRRIKRGPLLFSERTNR